MVKTIFFSAAGALLAIVATSGYAAAWTCAERAARCQELGGGLLGGVSDDVVQGDTSVCRAERSVVARQWRAARLPAQSEIDELGSR